MPTGEKIIRVLGYAIEGGPGLPYEPCFLKAYDPNSQHGHLTFTPSPDDALRFADVLCALKCWKQQSTTHPLRDDLRPNRPFTAYTIEVLDAPAPPHRH